MANPSKKKGTQGEVEAASWYRRWWPFVERRALRGIKDCGDLAGVGGYVVSVKRAESWPLHKWLTELDKMIANQRTETVCLGGWIHARRNRGRPVFIIPEQTMSHLLDAVYGGPIEEEITTHLKVVE